MKNLNILVIVLGLFVVFNSCGNDNEEIDQEKPAIDLTMADAFPVNCDTLYFGETFELRMLFTDNVELGSYSVDIHNNFDHHSHSTEVTECDLGDIKDAVNAFAYIEDYEIPEGENEYETSILITLPTGDSSGLYDEGDYHFFVSLTDKEGWSTQVGLSIKIFQK